MNVFLHQLASIVLLMKHSNYILYKIYTVSTVCLFLYSFEMLLGAHNTCDFLLCVIWWTGNSVIALHFGVVE